VRAIPTSDVCGKRVGSFMSAIGTLQTLMPTLNTSALRDKAEIGSAL